MPQWLSWLRGGFTWTWPGYDPCGSLWVVMRGKNVIAVRTSFDDAKFYSQPNDSISVMREEKRFLVDAPPEYQQRIYREV